jgi:hypothetical protein
MRSIACKPFELTHSAALLCRFLNGKEWPRSVYHYVPSSRYPPTYTFTKRIARLPSLTVSPQPGTIWLGYDAGV